MSKLGILNQTKTGIPQNNSSTNNKRNNRFLLMVDDVVRDNNHPYIKSTNDITAIGMVIGRILNPTPTSITVYAKPLNSTSTKIPIKGECVEVIEIPSTNNINGSSYFYNEPISLYGNDSVNYNPISISSDIDTEFDKKIPTLFPYEGDIIYEGRFGQGLRFSSTSKSNGLKNIWSDNTPIGDPITLLHNRINSSDSYSSENFTNTDSLIVLSSTQQLSTLGLASESFLSKYKNEKPTTYKSPQIILNSERIILNAKKDDIIISGDKSVSLYTNNNINIAANKKININSKEILLGSNDSKESALLGDSTVDTLNNIIDSLTPLITALSTLPGINAPASSTLSSLNAIKSTLNSLKSKDVKLS